MRLRPRPVERQLSAHDHDMLELAATAPPDLAEVLRAEVAAGPVGVADVLRVRCLLRGGRDPDYAAWVVGMLRGRFARSSPPW